MENIETIVKQRLVGKQITYWVLFYLDFRDNEHLDKLAVFDLTQMDLNGRVEERKSIIVEIKTIKKGLRKGMWVLCLKNNDELSVMPHDELSISPT